MNPFFIIVLLILFIFSVKKQYEANIKEIKEYIDTREIAPFNKYFLYGIIEIESFWEVLALNIFSGARGLFQITKICCKDINFCNWESLFNYKHNIDVGIAYLQKLYSDYEFTSTVEILISFKSGPTYLRELQTAHPIEWYNYLTYNEKLYISNFKNAIKKYGFDLNTIL